MTIGRDWFTDSFRHEFDKQVAELGRFNLAIFGKTGVGKSTLINAIFGAEVASTGIGEPVTRGSHLYVERTGHLGIVDTQGLEIGKDDKDILTELGKVVRESRRLPLPDQIHLAWYCVRGMDRRFEDAEAEFVKRLDELGLPVVLIMTQVPMRPAAGPEGPQAPAASSVGVAHPDAITLARAIEARRLPIAGGRPFLTYALADPFTGQQPYGLREVLDASFRLAPQAVHGALNVAQQIDLDRKAKAAQKFIGGAAAAAGGAALSPIPFSDAAMLVPIQLGMMAKIAQLYKIKYDRAALLAVASTTAATQAGRATFGGLIKLVPGAGSVVGGAMSAAVASGFTYAMGNAWLVVCQRVAAGKLGSVSGALDSEAVREVFLSEFKKRLSTVRHSETSGR